MKPALSIVLLFTVSFLVHAQEAKLGKSTKISWKKIVLDKNFRSEGVAAADVNKDGKVDVIVGDCWYEAPQDPAGEWKRHIIRADRKFDPLNYSDSFACFSNDFNGDSLPDVIVIPFPGNPCYWYENPGAIGGPWKAHLLTNSACNETPIYVDLFKTGKKSLVMGWNPQKDDKDIKKGNYDDRGEICYFVPGNDPTQPWTRVSISGPSAKGKTIPGTARFAHGLGHGDINGDGRADVIVPQGWWEQPEIHDGKPWKFHATNITAACADMHVIDIDGDGKSDIVSTSAHNYGFWWSQQKGPNSFLQRVLFPDPVAIAKLPADLKLSSEEKGLLDLINKHRADQQKRAPFAVDSELCDLARQFATHQARGLKNKITLGEGFSGKLVGKGFKVIATPAELKEWALAALDDKKGGPKLPSFRIGIGADQDASGKTVYVYLVGDRGHFSLPSQTHALQHVDIDGDGVKDLVTGRRWWAHGPKGDAAPNDPAYLYWFQAKKGNDGFVSFIPHEIDDDSGIGTQFAIADMNGDGVPDIVISNKRGVFVFLQIRAKE